MKKMITLCFVFLFLLSVVACCPNTGGDSKPGGSSNAVHFETPDSLTSTDEASGDTLDF